LMRGLGTIVLFVRPCRFREFLDQLKCSLARPSPLESETAVDRWLDLVLSPEPASASAPPSNRGERIEGDGSSASVPQAHQHPVMPHCLKLPCSFAATIVGRSYGRFMGSSQRFTSSSTCSSCHPVGPQPGSQRAATEPPIPVPAENGVHFPPVPASLRAAMRSTRSPKLSPKRIRMAPQSC